MASQNMSFYNTSCFERGLLRHNDVNDALGFHCNSVVFGQLKINCCCCLGEVCLGVNRVAKKDLILSQQFPLGVLVKALVMVH